ncbi:site-specific integrase [Desulfobacter postgatei]|uniref:site-specific integrase n=1 Tax=Desulfobacter postgatei TaxID=2293 RepID=UPI00259B99A2|nr:site-specific integrase [uncultured Desulfobacter sp.]
MSVYFNQTRNWWQYQFRYQKQSYTKAGFKTKKEALAAEAERKKEVKNPKQQTIQTDMDFLDLLNRRLDFVAAYRGERHYSDTLYMSKRWARTWKGKTVSQVNAGSIQTYLMNLKKSISPHAANKELTGLRSLFNWGIKKPNKWFKENPTDDLEFFPLEPKKKYVPPVNDVISVILAASGEVQDYLWTIALTLARMSEVNRMRKDDVDFENGIVTLYTRKSKGGNLVPREIEMTDTLRQVLMRRLQGNDSEWVFHHTYWSRKTGEWVTGPYTDRKRIMKTLCTKAKVRYFRYHPIRHFGASMLMKNGTDPRTIQDILGHSNFKTTEIYLHSLNGSAKTAMTKLETTLTEIKKCA